VERRELILDAAARVFAERGFGGATMKDIAAGAGVAKSVVYDHFASKSELYVELLTRHAEAMMAFVFDREPASSSERLFRDRTEAFFEFVERDRFAWRMLFREPPTGDRTVEALHALIHSRARDAICELFASATSWEFATDVPRRTVNEMAAQVVKSVNDGLAAWWYERPEVPRAVVSRLAVDLVWRGVERVTSAPRRRR
jgi:AcrR family transcriptional regulator